MKWIIKLLVKYEILTFNQIVETFLCKWLSVFSDCLLALLHDIILTIGYRATQWGSWALWDLMILGRELMIAIGKLNWPELNCMDSRSRLRDDAFHDAFVDLLVLELVLLVFLDESHLQTNLILDFPHIHVCSQVRSVGNTTERSRILASDVKDTGKKTMQQATEIFVITSTIAASLDSQKYNILLPSNFSPNMIWAISLLLITSTRAISWWCLQSLYVSNFCNSWALKLTTRVSSLYLPTINDEILLPFYYMKIYTLDFATWCTWAIDAFIQITKLDDVSIYIVGCSIEQLAQSPIVLEVQKSKNV